MKEFKPFYITR